MDVCQDGGHKITVTGWAYDPDSPSKSINVHVCVYKADGTTLYTDQTLTADRPRSDVNNSQGITGNHGFSTVIPISDTGTYRVKVVALDYNGDGDSQIGSTTSVTVTGSSPQSSLELCQGNDGSITVRGWAFDPDEPSASIGVQVAVYQENGTTLYVPVQELVADQPRSDVNNTYQIKGNHGFSATIPVDASGVYKVKVYAVDFTNDDNLQIGSTVTVYAAKTTTVSIGNAYSYSDYSPISYRNYSLTQQIYTAGEIGMTGTITSIAFRFDQAFTMSGIQIYLKQTDKSSFNGSRDLVDVTIDDMVYQGVYSSQSDGWATINLDRPFVYDGKSNLMVCCYDPVKGNNTGPHCSQHITDDNMRVYMESDSILPDITNTINFIGSSGVSSMRNDIRFNFRIPSSAMIGDNSTGYSQYCPFSPTNNYSLSQQIYTAGEIGDKAGTISSIAFRFDQAFSIGGAQIYLIHTDKSSFTNSNDLVPFSAEDMVFKGDITAQGAGWKTILFDTPFEYDGVSNLVVCCFDPVEGNSNGNPGCSNHLTGDIQCIFHTSDNRIPGIGVQSMNIDKNTTTLRNDIQFNMEPDIFPKPANLRPDGSTTSSVTLRWDAPSGASPTHYTYQYKTSSTSWTDETSVNNTSVTVSGLTPTTAYHFRVRAYYQDSSSKYVTTTATTRHSAVVARKAIFYGEEKYVATFYEESSPCVLPEWAVAYAVSKESSTEYIFQRFGYGDDRVIPADTPVVIVADKLPSDTGDTKEIPISAHPSWVVDNRFNSLKASSSPITVTNGMIDGKTVYVLGVKNGTAAFYKFSGNTIPAGKAYLLEK